MGHVGVDWSGRAGRRPARRRHRRAWLRRHSTGMAGARAVVGLGPGRLCRPTGVLTGGAGDRDMTEQLVATVAGLPISVDEIDSAEARLRSGARASALPASGTSEGRQLRRWLTQLIVTKRVVAAEAAARGLTAVTAEAAPTEAELLPDVTARLEIGSVAAAALADPDARALFADVTAAVQVSDDDVADYHARNPHRFAAARG